MNALQLITDYRDQDHYRTSFFQLAKETFGLQFEEWYEKGYWGDRYKCFSVVDQNKIVANVSVTEPDLVIEGKQYTALQIGTVMTNPQYQGRGLSKQLMNEVLATYAETIDIYYLFANKSVLSFYPKFGFTTVSQSAYSLATSSIERKPLEQRQLHIDNVADRLLIEQTIKNRHMRQTFSTKYADDLTLFHCLVNYRQNMYFIEALQTIVFYRIEGETIVIYDVIHEQPLPLQTVLAAIMPEEVKTISICFTPDDESKYEKSPFYDEGALFVKCKEGIHYPANVLYPYTSLA